MKQMVDEHLGGYFTGGDPATYCPALWKWLLDTFQIKSVLDVGCGEGQSTKFFLDHGCEVMGIEGSKRAVTDSVVPGKIVQWDYRNGPFIPTKPFDLVWCSEVLEHIDEPYLENVLETLFAGKVLAITAAPPGQGGHHHVNCRPASYWIDKISKWNFECSGKWSRMARAIATLENPTSHFSRTGLIFKKHFATLKGLCVSMTFISGDTFAQQSGVQKYLDSLEEHWPHHKVVFTHSLNPENRERLQDIGVEIIDVDPAQIKDVVVSRWYHYWKFLCHHDYRIVLITDSKDVLFQGNPADYTLPGEFLYLVSEGQFHCQSQWNIEEQHKFQEANNLSYEFMQLPVLNGGVQFGSGAKMREFCYLMHQGMRLSRSATSDQAFLNSMYRDLQLDPTIVIADPATNPLCATGDSIKNGTADHEAVYEGGKLLNPRLSRPYCMVHQWDRTAFAERILGLQSCIG